MGKPVTQADVARESGYSVDAVRDVFRLRPFGLVRPRAAKAILDAAERLDYRPYRQRDAWPATVRKTVLRAVGEDVEVQA